MSRPLADESVTVVGAGVGGLAAACHLADRGADVTVLERSAAPGGVASRIAVDGYRFDTGPSWYLMPEVFEHFFGQFDRSPGEFYDLERLDPRYRVFWKDGDRVDLRDDREAARDVFESYEDGAGAALDRYLADAEYTYEVGMERFVYPDRTRVRDFLDPSLARYAGGISLARTMQDHVERYFEHPKLQQLVQYTLVFLGGSPTNTPALYSLMSHVDFELGVYYPEGGMYAVVEALVDLADQLGVTVETGREVVSVGECAPGDRLSVWTADGPDRTADRVVCNANPAHVERELLAPAHRDHPPEYWDRRTYAPSAFMLYLGVEGSVDPLAHHTLVLPTDWDDHFASIFEDPAWPEDPAYYVSVPSLTDPTVAPEDGHTVVVLVPIAPGLDDGPERRERYRDRVLRDLAEYAGVDLRDRIAVERRACVSDFAEWVNAPRGTALGLAHTLDQTAPLRVTNRARNLPGLYYAGGYTTPGIGVPMCLLSGEHVADAVCEDVQGRSPALPTASELVGGRLGGLASLLR